MFSTFDPRLAEATPRDFEYAVARGSVMASLFGAPRHRLGRYELSRVLGEGAYGTVFAGRDLELDRPVAVKVVSVSATDQRLSEAQAMARVAHPNVVEVYDVGHQGDTLYIVMEVIEGENLAVWLQAERTLDEILSVFVDAGRGLVAAHEAGLVHRDFKPSNVMIAAGVAKVADFGLAETRAVSAQRSASDLTHSLAGTPIYMAPEQHRGETLDGGADQFAYCVALWEALAGGSPFEGQTPDALLEAKMSGPPSAQPRLASRRLGAIVRRGLAAAPEARFGSMEEIVTKLENLRARGSKRTLIGVVGASVAVGAWLFTGGGVRESTVRPTTSEASRTVEAVGGKDVLAALRPVIEAAARNPPALALEKIDALLAGAERDEDPVAITELLSARGYLLLQLDRNPDALAAFRDAYFLASQTDGRPAAALQAALDLAYVHAVREQRPDAGSRWMSIADSLLPQVRDRPQLRSHAFATRGSIDAERGLSSEALVNFRAAVALCEPPGSCGLDFTANVMGNYASVLLDLGETDEAIVVFEALLEEQSTRLGPGHVMVGVTLNRLGASRSQRGEDVAAGRYYQRALDIFETQLGPHHPQSLTTVGGLGHVAQVQGDFAKARAMYRRVARDLDGQRDVKRADVLNNLGVIALELGDLDAAVQRYETAIDVYTVALGRTHPHVGIALFGLGYAHLQRGEPDAAIAALEEALAISIRDDTTEGRRPSETRLWLAQALLAAGRDPQRTRALLESVAKGFEVLGAPAVDRLQETQRVLADLK